MLWASLLSNTGSVLPLPISTERHIYCIFSQQNPVLTLDQVCGQKRKAIILSPSNRSHVDHGHDVPAARSTLNTNVVDSRRAKPRWTQNVVEVDYILLPWLPSATLTLTTGL